MLHTLKFLMVIQTSNLPFSNSMPRSENMYKRDCMWMFTVLFMVNFRQSIDKNKENLRIFAEGK